MEGPFHAGSRVTLGMATPGGISPAGVEQVTALGFSANTVETSKEDVSVVGSLPKGSVWL